MKLRILEAQVQPEPLRGLSQNSAEIFQKPLSEKAMNTPRLRPYGRFGLGLGGQNFIVREGHPNCVGPSALGRKAFRCRRRSVSQSDFPNGRGTGWPLNGAGLGRPIRGMRFDTACCKKPSDGPRGQKVFVSHEPQRDTKSLSDYAVTTP